MIRKANVNNIELDEVGLEYNLGSNTDSKKLAYSIIKETKT